jgi:hypothetical protein
MKEAEEIASYCAECNDYDDESHEALGDQGAALAYTEVSGSFASWWLP